MELKSERHIIKKLDRIGEKIRDKFNSSDAVREKSLKSCRELIRLSSNSIKATHRRNAREAGRLVRSASVLVHELQVELKSNQFEILQLNFLHDAYKEYVEAVITFNIVFKNDMPDPDQLEVTYASYLNGLAESVGELRRFLLDNLRHGDLTESERLLDIMDHIYSLLITIDFPDAITFGLRRNTDNVRGILEKTRGDLTLFKQNALLQQRIDLLSQKLSNSAE